MAHWGQDGPMAHWGVAITLLLPLQAPCLPPLI